MNTTIVTIGRFRVLFFCSPPEDPVVERQLRVDAQRIIWQWAASGGYDHRDRVSVADE